MKSLSALFMILVALFLAAPSASAYEVDLTYWNITTGGGNTVTDKIQVFIGTNTIEFKFMAGNVTGTPKNMQDIYWDSNLGTATPSNSSYSSVASPTNPDGFNTAPPNQTGKVYPTYTTEYSNQGGGCTNPSDAGCSLDVTFTFAGTLPTTLTASNFVVHMQWTSCSGYVGGPGTGPTSGPGNSAGDVGNCGGTPVPEPMTVFLGGTGLLALAFVGRKRLFSGFAC